MQTMSVLIAFAFAVPPAPPCQSTSNCVGTSQDRYYLITKHKIKPHHITEYQRDSR